MRILRYMGIDINPHNNIDFCSLAAGAEYGFFVFIRTKDGKKYVYKNAEYIESTPAFNSVVVKSYKISGQSPEEALFTWEQIKRVVIRPMYYKAENFYFEGDGVPSNVKTE